MSDSVWPHRRQPTRLPRPWDSPGKNTGVGCHLLLQCVKVKVKLLSHVRLLGTPWTAAYQAPPSMGFSRQEYWPSHTRWCILNFPTVPKMCVLPIFENDCLMLMNEQGSIHTKMPMTKLASIKILTNFTLSCINVA